MKRLIFTGILALALFTACKEDKSRVEDKTPIATEELDDLAPDTTLNDIKTVQDVLERSPRYNGLLKMVNMANMFPEFKALENVTIFAPSQANVNQLLDDELASMNADERMKTLKSIVLYHIVKEEMDASRLVSTIEASDNGALRLQTLQGAYLSLSLDGTTIIVTDEKANSYKIINADVEASNGVIHDVERVLMPQENR